MMQLVWLKYSQLKILEEEVLFHALNIIQCMECG